MLKSAFPDAVLSYVTKAGYSCLLESNPHVDRVFSLAEPATLTHLFELRDTLIEKKPDMVIDLHSNLRSLILKILLPGRHFRYRKNTSARLASILLKRKLPHFDFVAERYFTAVEELGLKPDGHGLDFFSAETGEDLALIRSLGVDIEGGKVITLCPGAGRRTKEWPQEYFALLADMLAEKGYAPVLAGSGDEVELCSRIASRSGRDVPVAAGRLSLRQSGVLLARSLAAVCNDSGLMHLCGAVKTPFTAVFGPTSRELGFFPYQAESEVLETELTCRPCSRHGKAACPLGHFSCMKNITPVMVCEALQRIIDRNCPG